MNRHRWLGNQFDNIIMPGQTWIIPKGYPDILDCAEGEKFKIIECDFSNGGVWLVDWINSVDGWSPYLTRNQIVSAELLT